MLCFALRLRTIRLALTVIVSVVASTPVIASDAAEAIRSLTEKSRVSRTVRLSDVGFPTAIVMEGTDVRREFFWPVPKLASMHDPYINVRADYAKVPDSQTRLVFSVNGQPRDVRSLSNGSGRVSASLVVEPVGRDDRFVNFGVAWQSVEDLGLCGEENLLGNGLTLRPDTAIHYQLDYDEINSLGDAYAALPPEPVILVAGGTLDTASFDAAWRVGSALERDGKRPRVQALPHVGGKVDLGDVTVPAGLAGIPAFASGTGQIDDPAQVAALIMLGAAATRGDVLILDNNLREQIATGFTALKKQFGNDADALRALKVWQERRFALSEGDDPDNTVALVPFGTSRTIAVTADAGGSFAGILTNGWREMLGAKAVNVHAANAPGDAGQSRLPLPGLEGRAYRDDVRANGVWTTNVALTSLISDGAMPGRMVLDVAAAPGATRTRPVASVFWNDVLLGARQLNADGRPERLAVRVPAYALGVNNVLQVQFQRQPAHGGCHESPQAYPVAVLPGGYIQMEKARAGPSFVGVLPLMAAGPELILPKSWLSAAPRKLDQVIRLATASGISLTDTVLRLVSGDAPVQTDGAFLAMDVSIVDVLPKVTRDASSRVQIKGRSRSWLDIETPDLIGVLEVVQANAQYGLLWHSFANEQALPPTPFVLNRGDIVLLGSKGPVVWLDSAQPNSGTVRAGGESAFFEWHHFASWGMPLAAAVVLALLLLLWMARRARRRNKTEP